MSFNAVIPASTHAAPANTSAMSAVDIAQPANTVDLDNANSKMLATPAASDTSATKEEAGSSMQTPAKSSSKPGHRKRARATSEQVTVLESVFIVNRSPASRVREDLAARLGMAPRQVQVWFQNRRAKEKTQQRNPRTLQHHHPSMLLDQLAYANGPQDFYSMAMASSFMPHVGPDPGSAAASVGPGGFPTNPAALGFTSTTGPLVSSSAMHQHQQPGALVDGHAPFSAAAAAGPAPNPWLGWNFDMMRQGHPPPDLSQYLPVAISQGTLPQTTTPYHANTNAQAANGGAIYGGLAHFSGDMLQASGLKSAPESMHVDYNAAISASATSLTSLHAANIADSRRESEASGVTAVASPGGPGPVAMVVSGATAAALQEATPIADSTAAAKDSMMMDQDGWSKPHTPPDAEHILSATLVPLESPATSLLGPTPKASDGSGNGLVLGSEFPSDMPTHASNNGSLGTRCDAAGRRPAPLTLVPQQSTAQTSAATLQPTIGMGIGVGGMNANMGLNGRLSIGYSPFIPEIPSYMVLDASLLAVGSWTRVPKRDVELTCLACVAPPPLKPVMRPGNHRPAELDSLVGEFQWIISSAGKRYKMVLPYSAIFRIRFRELPDSAASLADVTLESVSNPQAALSLLSCALKNPQAKGELTIHIYDKPTYYMQAENGSWKDIGDFSENLTSSNTNVHTISGSFVTLFYQLRILLATCSRLKVAADSLMALWLGNMDDPYSAFSGIPHNTWTPCAEAVCLHSVKRSDSHPSVGHRNGNEHMVQTRRIPGEDATRDLPSAPYTAGVSPGFGAGMPMSAVSSTIGTLTPTPTSAGCFHANMPFINTPMPPALGSARNSAFAFQDAAQMAYNSTMAAAMANGTSGMSSLPLKTQRSASLPFIRSAAAAAGNGGGTNPKVNPSSSLCRSIESDGLLPAEADGTSSLEQSPICGSNGRIDNDNASASVTTAPCGDPPVGLGISNTPPPPSSATLPLRHRTSGNHLRRPAPYQVALPAGSPRVNSPQMSPSSFWHAHNLRRASRDSLSGYFHGQPSLGQNGQASASQTSIPSAALGRRESDTELALAMNNVFANGDVLGAHRRGLSEIYGASAIPPSPLSNVTMTAAASAGPSVSSAMSGVNASVLTDAYSSAPDNGPNAYIQQASGAEIPSSSSQNAGLDAPISASFASSASASLLTPVDFSGSLANQPSTAVEGSDGSNPGVIDPDVFMALFNAINGAPANTAHYPASIGQLNPTALAFDPNSFLAAQAVETKHLGNGPHAMDWCFDWNQSTSNNGSHLISQQTGTPDTRQSVSSTNGCNSGDITKNGSTSADAMDDLSMSIDWESKNSFATAVAVSSTEGAVGVSISTKAHE
ncbi:Short stature homeobox protein 2 [Coemansia sp. RSA 2399]|nr:Short stature homeobox protein 2 [Coemansia sp. RSA 2399]